MTFHGNIGDPGQCNECCEECSILKGFEEDQWEHVEGSSVFGSGTLTMPSPAREILIAPHPDGDTGNQAVLVRFSIDSLDSNLVRPRVIVAYQDDDNYLAVEVAYDDDGCSYLAMYQIAGGVATEIQDRQALPKATLTGDYQMRVCWEPHGTSSSGSGVDSNPGRLRAYVKLPTEEVYGSQAYAYALGDRVGLDCRAGTVIWTFLTFAHEYLDDVNCPDCQTPCPISSDDFSDADQSACAWDGGSVSGGQFTTAGHTLHLVFHPQLLSNMSASASVKDQNGTDAVIYVNDDGMGNFHKAVYSADATTHTLAIYRNTTLLETVTTSYTPLDAMTPFVACFSGHEMVAAVAGLCVREPSTEIPGGKWAALGGSALWDNWSLVKSDDGIQRCGVCGCRAVIDCSNCCDESVNDAYIIDLGAMGWTTNPDGFFVLVGPTFFVYVPCPSLCEFISGEFLVEESGTCAWNYEIEICFQDIGANHRRWYLTLTLTFAKFDGEEKCRWQLSFNLTHLETSFVTVQCGDFMGSPVAFAATATYRSDQIERDECDILPVTLSLIASDEPTGCPCDGTFPATITLRSPI